MKKAAEGFEGTLMIVKAVVITTVALTLFTGCEKTETPAPVASTVTEKPAAPPAPEPPVCSDCTPVTVDNFNRAESDMYFGVVAQEGGFGKLVNHREVMSIDKQTVVRANRDTLYSSEVFDLDAAPVTITMPDPGKRFMSLYVVDEDQYVPAVFYGAGKHTFTKKQIGTRYMLIGVRTFVDPGNPQDVQQVHALQDAIKVDQPSPGSLDLPKWDPVSQKKVRDALLVLASTIGDFKGAFGPRGQVSEVRHLVATAAAWGGNPEKDAIYLNVTPSKNDGNTVYRLKVTDVPVDGFWSISLYNAKGYFEKNQYDANTLNDVTAKKDADGSYTVQFGGCDGKIPNCLPIMLGWNYTVRLYRPRPEILTGKWKFPEAQITQ